jgi:hypothetical protein
MRASRGTVVLRDLWCGILRWAGLLRWLLPASNRIWGQTC